MYKGKKEEIFMLSIFAFLSDIPAYIAGLISALTGADASVITDGFNKLIAQVFELADKFTA